MGRVCIREHLARHLELLAVPCLISLWSLVFGCCHCSWFFFLSLASASQILLLPTLISPWLSNLFPLHSPGFCLHRSLPICSSLLFKSDFSFPPLHCIAFFSFSSHPQFGKLYLQPFGGFLGNCKQVSSMWCRQELVHRPAAAEKSWPVKQSTNWGYTVLYISPWHYVSLLKCNKQFNP